MDAMLGRVLGMLNRTPSMSQQLDELTEFGPDEVAEHNSTSSCWLVIDNLVYDVTNFHHPGGNDRLFDLAGTDVTQNFMAIGHSMAAHRQLRRLLIGRLQSDAHEPPPAPRVPAGYADTIERRALRGGSTHRLPRPNEPLWSTRSRGFLPTRDPLKELPPAYSVLTELVACLPTALADGSFRRLVEADAAHFEPLTNLIASEKSLDVLERVHALYGYIGKGYVHGHVDGDGAQLLPMHQNALPFHGRVGYHDYEGVSDNSDECERIAAVAKDKDIVIMRNHGILVFGRTVAEAYVRFHYFNKCAEVQLQVLATGVKPLLCPPPMIKHVQAQDELDVFHKGEWEWHAMIRLLENKHGVAYRL